MMNRLLAIVVLVCVAVSARAETFAWQGSGGVVDWSNAALWKNTSTQSTGTLPGDADTVEFWARQTVADFTVTPPASFAGTIKAMGNSYDASYGLQGNFFPATVKIVNANGASFTVGGSSGVLEAFDGIASMLDPAYSSVIDIPADVTLAPSAGFAANASFTGTGTFRPATAAQLANASAFRGTLDLRGIASLELGNDASLLMGRKVILGSGVSTAPDRRTTTIAPLDLSGSAWAFNTAFPSTEGCTPSIGADGTLTLPHVQGIQNKTSAYLNRRFLPDESFVLRFKVGIKANTGICGFGIVMRRGESTDVATGKDTVQGGSIPANSHGLVTLYYNNWGSSINVFERLNGRNWFQSWGSWQYMQQGSDAGFTLRNGSPIDATVTCHEGILSITLTQDGATRTFRQDVTGLFADPRGALFGFFTHEDYQATDTVSLEVKVSDLEGWVATDRNGQWAEDESSAFALNADNYYLFLDYKTGSVTNSFRGADALDAQGRLRVCEAANWVGAALSRQTVANRRFRLEWQDDLGSGANGGEHTDVGFVVAGDGAIPSYYGDPDVADGSGYGYHNRQYLTCGDPIKFCCSWYQQLYGLTRTWESGTVAGHYTGTTYAGAGYRIDRSTNRGKWFYDGAGFHTVRFCNSSANKARTFVMASQSLGSNRRLSVVGGGNLGWNCYHQNWWGGVKMAYWNEAYAPAACLTVAAPVGATTMPGVGALAPIARIELADATARLSLTGSVAFGDALELAAPATILKTVRTEANLVDLSAATVEGVLPTVVKLVDAAGAEIPLRGRSLTVSPAGVTLGAPLGLAVIVK